MALVLIATAGAVNANSYATVAECTAYHEAHLYSSPWTGASATQKTAALVWATRLMDDQFEYEGYKATVEQALQWPRGGAYDRNGYPIDYTEVPVEIKNAACEFARKLLETDRTADPDTLGFSKIVVGSISLDINPLDRLSTIPDTLYTSIRHLVRSRPGGPNVALVRA